MFRRIPIFQNLNTNQDLLLQHLLGYNLIAKDNQNYFIKIDLVKSYLKSKSKIILSNISVTDKWKTITEKRGVAEQKLRELIKLTLKIQYGSLKGRSEFLQIVDSSSPRYQKLSALNLDDIFTGENEIYLEDLKKFILKKWEIFEKVFIDKQLFDIYLTLINKHRADAHAKDIDDDVYQSVIISISWLNEKLNDVLE